MLFFYCIVKHICTIVPTLNALCKTPRGNLIEKLKQKRHSIKHFWRPQFNGQSVGLRIRKLGVRIPPGALVNSSTQKLFCLGFQVLFCYLPILSNHCPTFSTFMPLIVRKRRGFLCPYTAGCSVPHQSPQPDGFLPAVCDSRRDSIFAEVTWHC